MGLFNFFRDKTPPPLYMHGDPNSPDCFLSPIPPPDYRRRRSRNAPIPESQRRFVPCRNPRDPSDMRGLRRPEYLPQEDVYGGSQRELGISEGLLQENVYAGPYLRAGSARRGTVRRGVVDRLARARAHRRAAMYHQEGSGQFEQESQFAAEGNRGYGAGYPGSEGMESRGYARSLGTRSAGRGRGMLEAGYGGKGIRAVEGGIPAVGVFGVANPPYEAPRGRGRGMFAGGWIGAGRRGAMHGQGPFD